MIAERLLEQARRTPEAPFLILDARTVSYAEMAALAGRMAAWARDRGIAPGDRVALLCGNHAAFLTAWFGLAAAGAILVPLNTALVGDGLRYALAKSGARLLLAHSAELDGKREAIEAHGPALEIFTFDDDPALEASLPLRGWPGVVVEPRAPAAILYTSGTTGAPKGVVISHAAYLAAGAGIRDATAMTAGDRIMVVLPLFHANPQMYAVLSAIQCGAALVLRPRFSASRFFEDARRFGATCFTYVGTVLGILARQHATERLDHGLAWCVGGGAPAAVWDQIEARFGIAVRELYGMTETGGFVTINRADDHRRHSCGRRREDVEVAVVDEHDRPRAAGEIGEIAIRPREPDVLFSGYWEAPEITLAACRNLWFHTGDLGRFDADGYLYFEGRAKDLIRRAGEMISPGEIEASLARHPAVADCAVVGLPDEIMGEELKAAVVLGAEAEAAELAAFLRERVAAFMVPRYFEFVDRIPKTETHKVQRHRLQGRGPALIDLAPPRSPHGR